MRHIRFGLGLLVLLGVSSTALAETQLKNKQFSSEIGGEYAGAKFSAQSWRQFTLDGGTPANRANINTHATTAFWARLFGKNFWLYSGYGNANTTRFNWGTSTTNVSGNITVMGDTLFTKASAPTTLANAGFNETRSPGVMKFFSASHTFTIAFIPVTVTGTVRGEANANAVAWSHLTTAPRTAGENDFALSTFGPKPKIWGTGSVTVLTVGVYCDLEFIKGHVTPGASVVRTFLPNPAMFKEQARFDMVGNAPAGISAFGGEFGLTALGERLEIVDWGSPLKWNTALFPEERHSFTVESVF